MLIGFLLTALLQSATTSTTAQQGSENAALSEMRLLPLQHSAAAELRGVIGPFLRRGETLQADERTNSLILASSTGRLDELQVLIASLDQPVAPGTVSHAPQRSKAGADPFLPVASDLVLELGEQGKAPSLLALLRQYERISGQVLVMGEDVREMLAADSTGIDIALNVPKESAQTFVERLIVARDYYFLPNSGMHPRVVEVVSLRGRDRQKLMFHGFALEPALVEGFAAQHPAVAISCVYTMNGTDVRQLSNAMRMLFSDPQTSYLIPAGNSNSLILGGGADAVASVLRLLSVIDAAAQPPQAPAVVEAGQRGPAQ